ncbi:MAG: ribonuclease H-like domain-containing protein [Gammaproteobacteria bacterium]|nr:ribonuclease H-like domain-containing protein [Gammaproteobacteria bacterium]
MNFHKLTHNDAGRDVAPGSPDDREGWDEWVSATKTRGYLLGNTLGDWLHRYGEEHGFERDPTPDERLDLRRFNMKQGIAFEDHVASYLAERAELLRITTDGLESRDLEKGRATVAALEAGCEIVHGGVLWNPETRTYGIPDFLIRSDVFDRLFPGHPDPYEGLAGDQADVGARGRWRYVVVDAKFTTLHLFAEPAAGRKPRRGSRPGEINNDGSSPAYRAQLFLYNAALARLQGCAPRRAFLLGRGWEQNKERGFSAVDRLGPVSMTAEIAEAAQEAVHWIRRLREDGANWRVLPEPSLPKLRPPASGDADWPWQGAIRETIEKLDDPVLLWQVGAAKRDGAAAEGITSWRDPRATPASLGVHGGTTAPRLEAILDVNRTEGPVVRPERVTAAADVWRPRPRLEFFVDFETVNDINDDFSRFPARGGQQLIFMIGCGHVEDGAWRFSCFIADRLTAEAEVVAIDSWIEHMRSVRRRLGVTETPLAFHWAHAEQSTLEKAYNSACERHPGKSWADSPDFAWFDLLKNVVKAQPVVVRGAFGFGLKEIARTLHGHGLIDTSWDDSPVDGQGAMVGAWHCDREAAARGIRLADTELMHEIQHYNEVDCRVMQEILEYLRENH